MQPRELEIAAAKFDLTLDAAETPRGLALSFEYSRDLFDAATVKRLAGHYLALLEALPGDPARRLEELPMLGAAEWQQLRLEWNDTARGWDGPAASSVKSNLAAAISSSRGCMASGAGLLPRAPLPGPPLPGTPPPRVPPPGAPPAVQAFCSTISTWNSGVVPGSRSAARASTSFSKGRSWCA